MTIEFQDVTKAFDGKAVIEGFTGSFSEGLHLLVGPSGCGKSTLLSLIGRIDVPTSGRILFDGKEQTGKEEGNFPVETVSILFQEGNLFPERTAWDNLLLVTQDRGKIESLATRLGLLDRLSEKASHLSRGENARLSLAKVLLEARPVLILDEPTGNLDERNARLIYRILQEEAPRKTIFIATHDSDLASEYADDVLSFDQGRISCRRLRKEEPVVGSPAPAHKASNRHLFLRDLLLFAKALFSKMPVATLFFCLLSLVLSFAGTVGVEGMVSDPFARMREGLVQAGLTQALVPGNEAFGSGVLARARLEGTDVDLVFVEGDSPQIAIPVFDGAGGVGGEEAEVENGTKTWNLPLVEEKVDLEAIRQRLLEAPYVQRDQVSLEALSSFFLPQVTLPASELSGIVGVEACVLPLASIARQDFFHSNCAQFFDATDWDFWSDSLADFIPLCLLVGSVLFELLAFLLYAAGMRRQFARQSILLSLLGYRQRETFFLYLLSFSFTATLSSAFSSLVLYPSLYPLLEGAFEGLYGILGTMPVLLCDAFFVLAFLFFGVLLPLLFSTTRRIPTKKVNEMLKKDKM